MLNRTFSSLKYRNYRLFFFGQLISLVGTWMHWTAQQWLVYDITGSKAYLGIISASQMFPMLIFSIVGGMVADRISKRKILLAAQWGLLVSALILGALVLYELVQVWHIIVLAILSGIFGALAMPVRQAFVIELVGKDDLMNAIGLNSSIFNTARMLGPAIAAIVMSDFGIGWCFLINSVSYFAAIAGLVLMDSSTDVINRIGEKSIMEDLREGFAYIAAKKDLLYVFVTIAVVGIFGISYVVLIPAFAKDILFVEEKGYGFIMTFMGAGALVAALTVATMGQRAKRKRMIVLGIVLFCLSASVFSFSTSYFLSAVMVMISAFGITLFITTSNTYIQLAVPNEIRGRIMGIWAFIFGGTMPLGSLQAGFISEKIGSQLTVFIGSMACLVTVAFLGISFFKKGKYSSRPTAG